MIKDEELLKELRAATRQSRENLDEGLDERWSQLANGTISSADYAALQEIAQHDDEAARAFEAFKPLDDTFRENMTDQLVGLLNESVGNPTDNTSTPAQQRDEPGFFAQMANALQELFQLLSTPAVPAMAALALCLFFFLPSNQKSLLPAYSAVVSHGDMKVRSTPEARALGVPTFSVGSRVQLVARPETRFDGTLHVSVFLHNSEGLAPLNIVPVITETGAVRVRGTVGQDIPSAQGTYQIIIALTSKNQKLNQARVEELLLSDSMSGDDWHIISASIAIVDAR